MARPVSWLPRLDALQRSVGDSVRSHYSREDLERLFEIQPRSAQMLMGLMPTVRIGQNLLVERAALASFLGRLSASEDPASEFVSIRAQGKPQVVRRKLRELVQKDMDAELTATPASIALAPGSLQINFETVADLAGSLCWLASVMDEDLDGFAERYEPVREENAAEVAEREAEQADAAYFREFLAECNDGRG